MVLPPLTAPPFALFDTDKNVRTNHTAIACTFQEKLGGLCSFVRPPSIVIRSPWSRTKHILLVCAHAACPPHARTQRPLRAVVAPSQVQCARRKRLARQTGWQHEEGDVAALRAVHPDIPEGQPCVHQRARRDVRHQVRLQAIDLRRL